MPADSPSATAVAEPECDCGRMDCCFCCPPEVYRQRMDERAYRGRLDEYGLIFLANAGAVSKASQDSLVSLLELSGKAFLKRIAEPESDPFSSSDVNDLKNSGTVQMGQVVSSIQGLASQTNSQIQSLQAQIASLVAITANLARETPKE